MWTGVHGGQHMHRIRRPAEVREIGSDGRSFTAMAVRYNVVDSYDTVFLPGCFSASLERKLPKLTWGHDWSDIVGRVTDFEDTPEGLIAHCRLSDPEAVPRARQAIAQLRDGDVTDVSVGFSVVESERQDGRVSFAELEWDELALVLAGAVPGAKVLALRSNSVISAEIAGSIIARLGAGVLDLADALTEVKSAAIDQVEEPVSKESETTTSETAPAPETQPTPEQPTEPPATALVPEPTSETDTPAEPEAEAEAPAAPNAADAPVETAPNHPETVEGEDPTKEADKKLNDEELDALLADASSVLAGRDD